MTAELTDTTKAAGMLRLRNDITYYSPITPSKESKERRQVQIYEDQGSATVSIENLFLVQVGASNKSLDTPNKTRRRENRREPLSKQDSGLTRSSDEAAGVEVAKNEAPRKAEDINTFKPGVREDERGHNNEKRTETVLEYRLPLIEKQGFLKGVKCEIIMKNLELLQDSGRFREHEKFACAILELPRVDPDLAAALLIERGLAFYHANDLKQCKPLFNAAIRKAESLVNGSLLQARALFLKSTVYRRLMKYNKSLQCLQRAELLLSNHEPGEDTANLHYHYGTFWLYLHNTKPSDSRGRQVYRRRGTEALEKAMEHAARDDRWRVPLKRSIYCNLRIAALCLDCSSKMARQTPQYLTADIGEAEKRLDFVEYQLGDGLPRGTKVELLKTRSDQYYRQGNLGAAKKAAKEGLRIMMELEESSSENSLRERLRELQTLEEARPAKTTNEPVVRYTAADSGVSADCSSDQEAG